MLGLLLALLVSACASSSPPPAPANPSTSTSSSVREACQRGRAFIVVRHAEKATSDKDTPLSERGRARARTLASMLANAGVTRLYATQYKRTQETLAPLSERLSVPVEVRPADKTADLVAELTKAPDGSVIVVATHSNVLPSIVRELGHGAKLRGVQGDSLADDDYSRVVVITSRCSAQGENPTPFVLEFSSGDVSDSGKIAE